MFYESELRRMESTDVASLTNNELWQIASDDAFHSARRSEALKELDRRKN
jgi:hypothetical protein